MLEGRNEAHSICRNFYYGSGDLACLRGITRRLHDDAERKMNDVTGINLTPWGTENSRFSKRFSLVCIENLIRI